MTEIPIITRDAARRYSTSMREQLGGRGAFDTEITALGRRPRTEQRVERVVPPAHVAQVLGVTTNEPSTVLRARRMFADDVPIQIAESYIPLEIAAGTALEQADSGPGGIISRFAELGHAQVRITERLTVRPPTAEEAHFLRMTPEQRVYRVIHTGWTADDRPIEICVHVMPTHQWELEYEWATERT
ncbi:GntR family transcriptional regulator [Actinomadura nitritigenes]|uniref:GntR family transcriptional regulator n=1 Tax=Actinomadura nitritigenes TaxID=134602 RepID=UPI003D8FA17C